jgi:hypothetical protein
LSRLHLVWYLHERRKHLTFSRSHPEHIAELPGDSRQEYSIGSTIVPCVSSLDARLHLKHEFGSRVGDRNRTGSGAQLSELELLEPHSCHEGMHKEPHMSIKPAFHLPLIRSDLSIMSAGKSLARNDGDGPGKYQELKPVTDASPWPQQSNSADKSDTRDSGGERLLPNHYKAKPLSSVNLRETEANGYTRTQASSRDESLPLMAEPDNNGKIPYDKQTRRTPPIFVSPQLDSLQISSTPQQRCAKPTLSTHNQTYRIEFRAAYFKIRIAEENLKAAQDGFVNAQVALLDAEAAYLKCVNRAAQKFGFWAEALCPGTIKKEDGAKKANSLSGVMRRLRTTDEIKRGS